MNENKIIYRKEYVDNAIELIKLSEKELLEATEKIEKSMERIKNANEFPYIEKMNKNIKDYNIITLLQNLETEIKENKNILESSTIAIENYTRAKEEKNYKNPKTDSSSNPTIKNGPLIATLTGLATVGASALLSNTEEKEKTE